MKIKVQIIDARGNPVLDARVWHQDHRDGLLSSTPLAGAARYRSELDHRWSYMAGHKRVKSSPELVAAFKKAGMFGPKETKVAP